MTSTSAKRARRRLRWVTRSLMLMVASSATIVLTSAPASASCPLLDPDCLRTTLGHTGGTVTGTIEDPVGTVNGTTDDPVGTVTGAAAGVTGQAGDIVDGLLGNGPQDPPGGGGTGGDPTTPPPGGGPGNGSTGRPRHVPGRSPAQSTGLLPAGAIDDPTGPGLDLPSSGDPRGPGLIAGTVAGVAKRLGFPMALALLVLAFAALQHRLDRNDPRMARAPVVPDVMRFD